MIVYGTRGKQVASETIFTKCVHCGAQNAVDVNVYQRWAHVFWIPFFPIGKTGISQCSQCKQTLKYKEMPDSYKETYNSLKLQAKTPFYTFSGLVIVAALIALGAVLNKERHARMAVQLQSPQAGDIYKIKLAAKSFTLYKVHHVAGDSVYLQENMYEVNKRSGLDGLKRKNQFDTATFGLPKAELAAMDKNGELIDIDR